MEKKEIQKKMRESLPIHMIPKTFYSMEELPMTQNGKIDRKKLRDYGRLK